MQAFSNDGFGPTIRRSAYRYFGDSTVITNGGNSVTVKWRTGAGERQYWAANRKRLHETA